MDIDHAWVKTWAAQYDARFRGKPDAIVEEQLRSWLARTPVPKYLDKEHFLLLARWKSPRAQTRYAQNDDRLVREATRLSYEADDPRIKLHILRVIDGVGVPVASTILHFLQPDGFAIFDVRVRTSLKQAGLWDRATADSSTQAWIAFNSLMKQLATSAGTDLRTLDKALWQYNAQRVSP